MQVFRYNEVEKSMSFPSKKLASIVAAVLALAGCSVGATSQSLPASDQNPSPLRQCTQIASHTSQDVYETHPRRMCVTPDRPKPMPYAPGCRPLDGHVSNTIGDMRVGEQCYTSSANINITKIDTFWVKSAGPVFSVSWYGADARVRHMAGGYEVDLGVNNRSQKFFIRTYDGLVNGIGDGWLSAKVIPDGLSPGEKYDQQSCMSEVSYLAQSVADMPIGERCYISPVGLTRDDDGNFWISTDFETYPKKDSVSTMLVIHDASGYHAELDAAQEPLTRRGGDRSMYDYPDSMWVPATMVMK